ncbi:MAG: hypothetical protein IKS48_07335 [Eubacterium sp.]|nr:hypothetical protein [Eubacterium sp.]
MAFLNQFATYFNAQEKETELYQLWSSIGVNMEKAILEEQNRINAEFTDINNFSEDTMRSWLAFFLQKIPYRTTATTQVSVSLDDGDYARTTINKYDELTTDDGVIYTLMEDIVLLEGDIRTVTAVQGTRITETGTYHSIIKFQANNPDLSYLTVKINGEEIPEVSYETSYDQLSFLGSWKPQKEIEHDYGGTPYLQDEYGIKGEAYWVIADGETKFSVEGLPIEFRRGDLVVYDGEKWQRSAYTNKLSPIQFADTFAVPRNGYFAYYYDGYLYIKVFAGTEINNPNGQPYEVSYIKSDGIQGEIEENQLHFVSSYEDLNENTVKLVVTNTKSSVAINEPSTGKLGLYLKQRLYSSINVSSVPEYTAWFNAQPEVGDCLVLSDYERWVRQGKTTMEVTGIVDIYLVDPNGNSLASDVKERLLERIEPYKDIAVLQISEFTPVEQHLAFEYSTTTSMESFEQFVKAKASQYYNLAYLQSKDSSLFENLDLAAIIQDIQQTSPYASTGLILKGYHYLRYHELVSYGMRISQESYADERPGRGWCTLTYKTKKIIDGEEKEVEVTRILEEVEIAGSLVSCQIYDEYNTAVPVGSHVEKLVTLDFTNPQLYSSGGVSDPNLAGETVPMTDAVLEFYWGMENEGILSIGDEKGLRKLHSIDIKKV